MPFIGGVGPLEWIIILVIVIIIFGVGRLPTVGGALGKSIREFREQARPDEDEDADGKADDQEDGTDSQESDNGENDTSSSSGAESRKGTPDDKDG